MKHFPRFILGLLLISIISCTPNEDSQDSTVYSYVSSSLKGFDPIHASDTYTMELVSQIYEGLYHYHYLKRPLELTPQLATAMPTISRDGKTYTIPIKKGVLFQDSLAFPVKKGRELKASDFIYSWKRLADPSTKSPGFWVFDGRIVGLNEWRRSLIDGTGKFDDPVAGLKAIDDYTLQIQLKEPYYQFLHVLAMPFTKVVPREAVESFGTDFINKPVGTGPFVLKRWLRNSSIILEKNPTYRDAFFPSEGMPEDKKMGRLNDAGKKLPLADRVEIRISQERLPTWLNFMNGDLDLGVIPHSSFAHVIEKGQLTQEMAKKYVKVHSEPKVDVTFLSFNMEHPILGRNKKLRQAIAMAYNSNLSLETFFKGRGIVASGPIPPYVDGYDPQFESPIQFNVKRARELMREAGYPEGKGLPPFKFDLPSTASVIRQMGEFVKTQLDQIGVKVRLVTNTWPQFDKKVKSRNVEMFSMAYAADYPDAENFLRLFYSKNVSPGSNMTNYASRSFDKLYESASILPPGPKRTNLYKKMNRMIVEESPAVFEVHRSSYYPYHTWLKNYKRNNMVLDFYKYLRVDAKKRAKLKAKL